MEISASGNSSVESKMKTKHLKGLCWTVWKGERAKIPMFVNHCSV